MAQRSFAANEIDEAIAHCEHYGWLNDARVAEMLLRHGISKGHGLSRIRQDCQRKGISASLTDQATESLEFDWYEHAREIATRKFGVLGELTKAKDPKEHAKRMRYLQYRGFDFDQIRYALNPED
ncbi:recombination regulator RecX [Parasalinivibrio latis]